MIAELAHPPAILVIVLWALGLLATECPPGWYVDGVRPSGLFTCRPVLGDPEHDLDDAPLEADERATVGVIYCTGGARPVVNGPRTVGCQR